MQISTEDKIILREMAKKQLELANSPEMKKLRAEWELHGMLSKRARPMIRVELWTLEHDLIPSRLRCQGENARKIEWEMHANVMNHTMFGNDTIVKDYIPWRYKYKFQPFGIPVKIQGAGNDTAEETDSTSISAAASLGHHFIPAIADLEEDFNKLGKSEFIISQEPDEYDLLKQDLFGDILPLRLRGDCLAACPMQDIIHIMSMEDLFMSMYDYPDLFHKMMQMLTDDYLNFFKTMEQQNAILPTYGDAHLNQGSYCYNNVLPGAESESSSKRIKTKDVLFYMDAQESTGISPTMFGEFIAPYYKKLSDQFGLLSYGCCEAVDPIWDDYLKPLDNLRKVSISPWCNEEIMGEKLKDATTVYLRKPSPNFLGVGNNLDEEALREHIQKTVSNANGCALEFAQRDVYSVNNNPAKVRRYVEIVRECSESHKR
jgi:hypothetical protein